MSNMRMLINNLWPQAQLSVIKGTPIASLPLKNSQFYGRSYTAGITPENGESAMQFNLPGLSLINGLVFYRHWLSKVGNWRVVFKDGPHFSGNTLLDTGVVPAVQSKTISELNWIVEPFISTAFDNWDYKFSQLWTERMLVHSGRIYLYDNDSREGIHEFDQVYMGPVFQPYWNFLKGHQHQWDSLEEVIETEGGSVHGDPKPQFRRLELGLTGLSSAEQVQFDQASEKVGLTRDWFISLYPEENSYREVQHAMSCKFVSKPRIIFDHENYHSLAISVREA